MHEMLAQESKEHKSSSTVRIRLEATSIIQAVKLGLVVVTSFGRDARHWHFVMVFPVPGPDLRLGGRFIQQLLAKHIESLLT